ncbi:MAG: C40 family peptidase [Microbacteriaceae bacterium]
MTQVGPNDTPDASAVEKYPSRKDVRVARGTALRAPFGSSFARKKNSASRSVPAMPTAPRAVSSSVVPAAFAAPVAVAKVKADRKSSLLSIAVTAFVVPGLFATVALPAYAYTPAPEVDGETASVQLEEFKAADAQTVFVATGAEAPIVAREAFSATTHAELERARLAVQYRAYTGPSTADYLQNPSYPSFSLDAVYSVGLQYQGVPYRYGGSNPSGFDCSGFVQFVYAQFGVSLPHSVSGQSAAGTRISRDAALPGDLVIMPGHNGFYAGNGNILDSPRPGGVVSVRPIWTDNYYIVRIGI